MTTRWLASPLFALALFLGAHTATTKAEKALLILSRRGETCIVTTSDLASSINIGSQVIYGQSPTHIGIVSWLPGDRTPNFTLKLIDKFPKIEDARSSSHVKSLPIEGLVMSHLEGPLDTLLLTAKHAYYFSPFPRVFTLVQLSLTTGEATRITYPPEIRNPRITGAVTDGSEHLFAYGKGEEGIWKYDAKRSEFVSIDPPETDGKPRFTFKAEAEKKSASPSTNKIADLAYLPAHGLYKLTTDGILSLVLNSEFVPPTEEQQLTIKGVTGERLLPSPNGEPRLGILTKKDESLEVAIVNLITFEVESRIALPKATNPLTVYPFLMGNAGDNSIYLLNAATSALEKFTSKKSEAIQKLSDLDKTVFTEDRILYLQNEK